MEKTIAAISTGNVSSGIAIVRLSGPEALRIIDNLFSGSKRPSTWESHHLYYGQIVKENEPVDEVLVSYMKGPHSYTGEDVVEINSHGGTFVAKKILELLLQSGATLATPGEFTKRAFLNGRIDLTKAEAVLDIIEAKNDFALKAGNRALKGQVEKKIRALRDQILDECAYIEAALDDPEHYDLTGYSKELRPKVTEIYDEINRMAKNADFGEMMKEGIRTVIAGRPNAGKSSLLNLLSGSEKAIVTDVAGTTRDVLEVSVRFKDFTLLLKDTAGLRESEDIVESIGVKRARKEIADSDLLLYVVGEEKVSAEDEDVLRENAAIPTILIRNKKDLYKINENDIYTIGDLRIPAIPFSCTNGEGKEELKKKIGELFEVGRIHENEEMWITNERQKNLLITAAESLQCVLQSLDEEATEDFLTGDLMSAYETLGLIIGENVTDDMTDRIFEKFCMGK